MLSEIGLRRFEVGRRLPCPVALVLAGLYCMSGCGGGLLHGDQPSASQVVRPAAGPRLPGIADPDYEQTYARHREQMSNRPAVAPALGYKAPSGGTSIRQVGLGGGVSSIAKSVSTSVQNGFSKVGAAITPEERRESADEPTSVFNNSKPGPELHVAMARLNEESGDLAEAEQQYRHALALAPAHLGGLLGYAHLKDRVGRLDDAVQLYQQAIAAHPNEPSVFNDMGLCLARNGQLREAMTALNRAVQLQPKKPLYRNNVAIVLTEMGQTETAFLHLRIVHPEAVARYNLGHLLLRKGDRPAAAGQFALALQSDPSLAQARAWLAELSRSGVTPTQPVQRTATRPRTTTGQQPVRRDLPTVRPSPPRPTPPRTSEAPAPQQPPANSNRLRSAPQPTSEQRPSNDLRAIYGNRPVPPGRMIDVRTRRPARPQTPPSPPVPAPAQRTSTPIMQTPAPPQASAGLPTAREPVNLPPRQAPLPRLGRGELAPLPPVAESGPQIRPLPPVEPAPLPPE